MKTHLLFFLLIIFSLLGCQSKQSSKQKEDQTPLKYSLKIQPVEVNSTASFRGICAVNEEVIWVSGTEGTVLRSIDSGKNWQTLKVPQADTLDFRDIEAFDEHTAYILSSGQPARLYKTEDGGKSWILQYESQEPAAFFDGISFWDESHGFAMSDPIQGEFLIIRTGDGKNWTKVKGEQIPDALDGEGGFAASGTNVATIKGGKAWFVTGGPAARIFTSPDYAKNWEVFDTPVHSDLEYSGIYSVAFKDSQYGIAVGGTFAYPDSMINHAALTKDGGKTWQLIKENSPGGYRSCVAFLPFADTVWITVSRNGGDISYDNGYTWEKYTDEVYYSISIPKNSKTGWISGPKGKVAKIEFK